MQIPWKNAVKPVVALCLLFCLSACGNHEDDISEKNSTDANNFGMVYAEETVYEDEMVYVPQFYEAELDVAYVNTGCVIDENVYLVGAVDQTDTTLDPDTGETNFICRSGCALFRAPVNSSTYEHLEGYHPFDFLNGASGNVFSDGIYPGKGGSLWISTYVSSQNNAQTIYLQKFDSSGNELAQIDLSTLSKDVNVSDMISTVVDREDNLYICTMDQIMVYDSDQNHLFTLKAKSKVEWNETLILLGDGQVGLRASQSGSVGEDPNDTLWTVDVTGKEWGTSYPLPTGSGKIYPGSGGYLFFCDSGDYLYGYRSKTESFERLISWTDVGINSEAVLWLSALENGQLAAVIYGNGRTETAVMTKTDPSTLPPKTVLTYATMQLRSDVRADIIAFNKSHRNCKIEVKDYSEYNTPTDRTQGLRKLNTELLAGKIDILDTDGIPVRRYGSNGILEDLLPWLENDPELGRDSVVEQVLEAAVQGGKLYQAFDSFVILSAAGDPRIVGNRLSWTLEDLKSAYANMPEGSTIFGDAETKETVLEKLLPMELDRFVDWEAGTCRFDSDAFKALLEFCNKIPPVSAKEEYRFDRVAEGRQLLLCVELGRLDWEYFLYPAAFGGACSFVGYPRQDGTVGSCFRLNDGAAITASCKEKDLAWAFVREYFLPHYSADSGDIPVFSSNAADFHRAMELAAVPIFEYDESGNIRMDEAGQPIELQSALILPDSRLEIPVRAITEAEYDQFMELFHSINTVYSFDEEIDSIVREEAGAFFSGDKSIADVTALIQNRAALYMNESQIYKK